MDSQQIINVIYIFGNAFRICAIYQFVKIFFNTTADTLRYVMRILAYFVFFGLNSASFLWFHWTPTIIMISNFAGILVITLTYRGRWLYRIVATALVAGFTVLCEDLIYFSLLALGVEHIVVIGISLSALLFFVLVIFMQKLSDIRHGQDILPAQWISIVLVPACSMVISVTALADCSSDIAVAIGEIGLLILNILVFYLFDSISKTYQKKTYFQTLEAQNIAYEKQLHILKESEEKIATFRHDMRNHILNLKTLSQQGDGKGVMDYLGEIESEIKPKEQFVSTGDYLFDGLINLKLSEAAYKLGANVEHNIIISGHSSYSKMDVSIILGNLLDNALEAIRECTDNRSLKIYISESKNILVIKIENTYNGQLKEESGSILTTKKDKDNHGLGIKNVKRIVEKYNGEMKISYTEKIFSVNVLMYLNN